MLRGNRRIILAAVGWLILAAQHPNPEAKAEHSIADTSVSDALNNIAATYHEQAKDAKASPLDRQCDPGDDHRDSDLCAQWKAADASEKAAWWAAFAGLFGGLSFLSVLGALGLAFHSNWIARDAAQRELRAYISVTSIKSTLANDRVLGCDIVLENKGQTPANRVSAHYYLSPIRAGQSLHPIDIKDADSRGSIGPSVIMNMPIRFPRPLDDGEVRDILNGSLRIFAHGKITYEDAFGKFRRTDFKALYDGSDFHMCSDGNDAT